MSYLDINSEEMRYEAAWDGFTKKDYSKMYLYLVAKGGTMLAEHFRGESKKYKRCFCARIVYYFHPNGEYRKKAEKYYKKHREEFDL